MDNFFINPVDIVVALVMLISAFLAFARGAVREILGVSAWVGAALAAAFSFPHIKSYPRKWVNENWPQLDMGETLADAGTALILFIVSLIILTIFNQIISGYVQRSRMGALDRSIGFIFGLLRGAIIICLAYMLFIWAVKDSEDRPKWVERAKTINYIQTGAQMIREITPEEFRKNVSKKAENAKQNTENIRDTEKTIRALSEPTLNNSEKENDSVGYDNSERDALDSLSNSLND